MAVSGDVLAQVLVQTYTHYPQLVQNRTVTEIFAIIAQNDTLLRSMGQITGINATIIKSTVGTWLYVMQLMAATPAPTTAPTNATNSSTTCVPFPSRGSFTNYCLVPALMIMILLSFLRQRVHSRRILGLTITRPALCIPLNLLDSYENRFAYACAFGATVGKCLNILFFSDYSEIFNEEVAALQRDPTTPGWTGILWKMLAMIVLGLSYYPFFACLATEYKLLGGIIGVLYSATWLGVSVSQMVQCPQNYASLIYTGDLFAIELPTYACLTFLLLNYIIYVGKELMKRFRRNHTVTADEYEEEEWKKSYKYKYVVKLLQPVPKEPDPTSLNCKDKIVSKVYKWKPEFKYSTRVVCTYAVGFVCLYEIAATLVVLGGFLYIYLIDFLTKNQNIAKQIGLKPEDLAHLVLICYVSWFVSLAISCLLCFVLITNMLTWYRGHVTRLQRGDKSFLPVQALSNSPTSITVATLRYSGYQVAYISWGFVIMHLLLFVVAVVLGEQLLQPMIDGKFDSFLWLQLFKLWPVAILSLVFFLVQFLLARFVFLHDGGSSLALNNRRLFHICTYFLFFFNIFLGLVSCLQRILIGAALGVFFLARTQKSLVPRDFELRDPGFNAYVGYLYLEHTHSNPVLVTFCWLLVTGVSRKRRQTAGDSGNPMIDPVAARRGRVARRWALFVTLSNNRRLSEYRRREKFIEKSPFSALRLMLDDFAQSNYAGYRTDEETHGATTRDFEDTDVTYTSAL